MQRMPFRIWGRVTQLAFDSFRQYQDPMVVGLLRNKFDQYDDYSLPALEAALHEHGFRIRNRTVLPSGERTLLHVVPETLPAGAT